MRLDLYQAETARIAALQTAVLDQAREIIASGRQFTLLEQGGVLHALLATYYSVTEQRLGRMECA